ncbi:MAG: transporter substrate-binding domain-containing protein [Synergistaceae bacterium]|nr:transporter substrate-binding domain-containing protein [Synergistaceae bacterium]
MKKFLVAIFVLALFVGVCFAENGNELTGLLSHANVSHEEYDKFIDTAQADDVWDYYALDDPKYPAKYFKLKTDFIFFDTVAEMIMALNSGKIAKMEMAEPVGKYFLAQDNNAEKYITYIYANGVNYYLSMGFNKGNKWFEPFNNAIKAMNEDGTVLLLQAKYTGKNVNQDELKPITFEKFPDVETVKIAITGDIPPIDYIDADGTPAGFNTAMLAEIARRLKINIELVSITTGARAAALSSGRVDGVFWFWYEKVSGSLRDVPENVELTEPYYDWDSFMYLGKKIK